MRLAPGLAGPWSAGAESDFDLALPLVGSAGNEEAPRRSAATVVGPAAASPIFSAIIRSLRCSLFLVSGLAVVRGPGRASRVPGPHDHVSLPVEEKQARMLSVRPSVRSPIFLGHLGAERPGVPKLMVSTDTK